MQSKICLYNLKDLNFNYKLRFSVGDVANSQQQRTKVSIKFKNAKITLFVPL